jgi:hypothetical protein
LGIGDHERGYICGRVASKPQSERSRLAAPPHNRCACLNGVLDQLYSVDFALINEAIEALMHHRFDPMLCEHSLRAHPR